MSAAAPETATVSAASPVTTPVAAPVATPAAASGAGHGQPPGRHHAGHGRGGHIAPSRPPGEAGLDLTGGRRTSRSGCARSTPPGYRGPGPRHRAGCGGAQGRRFVYKPPPEGLATRLARLYVSRGQWGKWALGGLVAPFIVWAGYWFAVGLPDAALPRPDASPLAGDRPRDGRCRRPHRGGCRPRRGAGGPRTRIPTPPGRLCATSRTCAGCSIRSTRLRIVNRPGERSGVFRVPDVNSAAGNYYIVVEGIDATGEPVTVPIKNEETGKTEVVTKWGLRVDEAIYNAVGRDKADDGIVRGIDSGPSGAGTWSPTMRMPTTGGAITRW